MRRREFIRLFSSSVVAWPLTARAQQAAMPVIGFLNGGSAEALQSLVAAFREGLSESGYVEGQNLAIEYRWADGDYQKLPRLAADLVGRLALANRLRVPTIYDLREFVVAGGLISYAPSITQVYRQAGIHVGKIVKGAKPADLPVLQPTKFDLVINLKTAKTLGVTVSNQMQLLADEVIE
jgi:ABC-type uncharacterized transport system substrate-binding protein